MSAGEGRGSNGEDSLLPVAGFGGVMASSACVMLHNARELALPGNSVCSQRHLFSKCFGTFEHR